MCYTKQTSINAFVIGSLLSIYIMRKDNKDLKIIGGFLLFVSFMQLFDAIFWEYPTGKINELTTKVACIFNHLQPIVLAFLIIKYKGYLSDKLFILLFAYTLITTAYTIANWNLLNTTTVTTNSGMSLDWKWNHFDGSVLVYSLFLITLLALMMSLSSPYNKVIFMVTLIGFIFSYYKYQIQRSTGRFWCYFAAYAPAIFLLF